MRLFEYIYYRVAKRFYKRDGSSGYRAVGEPQVMSTEVFSSKKNDLQGIFYKVPFEGGQAMGHIDLINHGQAGSGFASGAEVWYWPIK